MSQNEIRKHEDIRNNISKHLNDMKEGEDITFDPLLINLNVTEKNYYLAIRSGLNSPTVFLKRNPDELRVNNYNSDCLSAWTANMDIQPTVFLKRNPNELRVNNYNSACLSA